MMQCLSSYYGLSLFIWGIKVSNFLNNTISMYLFLFRRGNVFPLNLIHITIINEAVAIVVESDTTNVLNFSGQQTAIHSHERKSVPGWQKTRTQRRRNQKPGWALSLKFGSSLTCTSGAIAVI
jgi:hypothetical protein